jgi:hypothetical protein
VVAAGQREDLTAAAGVAMDGGGAQCLGAAALDRRQGLVVAGRQPAAVYFCSRSGKMPHRVCQPC